VHPFQTKKQKKKSITFCACSSYLFDWSFICRTHRQTLQFIVSLQNRTTHNYPSSIPLAPDEGTWGDINDTLVHFCHGATGAVFALCRAYEVFRTCPAPLIRDVEGEELGIHFAWHCVSISIGCASNAHLLANEQLHEHFFSSSSSFFFSL
jgi:hypothetical protein